MNIIKLPVGTIYRKLIMKFVDNNGAALNDGNFTGMIDFVFNQADTPYSIDPRTFSALNHLDLGVHYQKVFIHGTLVTKDFQIMVDLKIMWIVNA